MDGPNPHIMDVPSAHDEEVAKLQRRRDQGMWYAVAGVAMLFAGSISTALAIGGVLMVAFGAARYIEGSVRLRRHNEDPWKDPELDAWEEEHYGEGTDDGGESIVDESPDAAWGGRNR